MLTLSSTLYLRYAASSVVKHIDIGAVGLGFDSRAGQIGHSVASGSPLLRHFLGVVLPRR